MSWDNISKTLGSVIDERLSSPLISTFVISWSLWNYKFFVLLFSKTPAVETITLIKQICFPDAWAIAVNGVLLPALTTALYLFALPRPSRWVSKWWRLQQKGVEDDRRSIDGTVTLTLEQSNELKSENIRLRSELGKLTIERDEANEQRNLSEALKEAAEASRLEAEAISATRAGQLNDLSGQIEDARRRGRYLLQQTISSATIIQQLFDLLDTDKTVPEGIGAIEWAVLKHLEESGEFKRGLDVETLRAMSAYLKFDIPEDGRSFRVVTEPLSDIQEMKLIDGNFVADHEDNREFRLTARGLRLFTRLKQFDAILSVKGEDTLKAALHKMWAAATDEISEMSSRGELPQQS
jgi:hypothetical protein